MSFDFTFWNSLAKARAGYKIKNYHTTYQSVAVFIKIITNCKLQRTSIPRLARYSNFSNLPSKILEFV